MISHLGRKPVSGGRPPMDSKVIAIRGSRIGILFHKRDVVLIDVSECGYRIENIVSVIRM